MKKEIDWMGRWYDIIKERGENDRPTFGQLDLETKKIKWFDFSHSEMDGVGAMISYYKNTNFDLKKYPSLRESALPTFFERIKIFYRLIFKSKKIKTKWNEKNVGTEPDDPMLVHYKIFDIDQVRAIENYCKNNSFSVNAFLMNISTKVLLSTLAKSSEGTWTLPVNLRPVLKREDITSNHSSAVLINVSTVDNPLDTHKKISSALKNKEHWGIWWIHQIGKFVGYKVMKYLSNKAAQSNFIIGSFSNLSSWDLPPHHIWVGGPPGSKNFPISIMVMKASGHMSFSLKIHPFIMKDCTQTQKLLNKLTNEILRIVDKNS